MRKLGSVDMVMLMVDSPRTPNHMGPLLICDPKRSFVDPLTFTELVDGVAAKLDGAPMLRRRLIGSPLGLDNPYWVDDPNFDIEFHIRQTALPKPGDWKQLCTHISRLTSRQIDLTRPPWELYVIEGLDNIPGVPQDAFGVFIKIHHTAIDGREGVELLNVLTSVEPGLDVPQSAATEWSPLPLPTPWNMWWRTIASLPERPVAAVRLLGKALPAAARAGLGLLRFDDQSAPITAPYTRFSGVASPHRIFDATEFRFADIKRLRARVPGATVNDVALSVVGGALRRYLQKHEELPSEAMSAMVPISTRTAEEVGEGGNQISNTKVGLATDIDDDLERLATISAATQNIKTVRRGVGASQLAALSEVVPGQLLGAGLRATAELAARAKLVAAANVAVTNVPGPRVPLYFLGSKVISMYGVGPIQEGMGVIHLVGSYCDVLSISVVGDRDTLGDIEFYMQCLRESFEALSR